MSYHQSTAVTSEAGLLFVKGISGSPDISSLGLYRPHLNGPQSFSRVDLLPSLHLSKCQIISLGQKIYFLGGEENSDTSLASQKVHSYDVVDGSWTRCANMQRRRMSFGIGALDGKIYVFGGLNLGGSLRHCEVYDPKVNAWSRIADMVKRRAEHQVAVVGKFFIIFSGILFETTGAVNYSPSTAAIYNQGENRWFTSYYLGAVENNLFCHDVFMVNGLFHRFTDDTIDVYDFVTRRWRTLHDIYLDPAEDFGRWGDVIMVGGELLTVCHIGSQTDNPIACLLQTNGFGGNKKLIGATIVKVFPRQFYEDSTILFYLDM